MKHLLRAFLALIACAGASGLMAQTATLDVVLVGETANGKTYRLYAHLPNTTDELVSVFGYINPTLSAPMVINSTAPFYQDPFGGNFASNINPAFFVFFPNVQYDSWFTLGPASSQDAGTVSSVGMDGYLSTFAGGNGFNITTELGGALYIIPGSVPSAVAGPDNRVLVAQLTSTGVMNVTLNFQWENAAGATLQAVGLSATFPVIPAGCTDATACNFDPVAQINNGTCTYPGTACNDGNPNTVGDVLSSTCTCAGTLQIPGCTDATACNYNAAANVSNGSCTYAQSGYDCAGNCLNDLNGNGLCDNEEVFGCTAEDADNYNPAATTENGTCTWAGGLVTGLTYEVVSENGIPDKTTYRIYAEVSQASAEIVAVYGYDTTPWLLSSTTGFYQDAFGSGTAGGVNAAFFPFVPALQYDSWVTLGALPGAPNAASSVGMSAFLPAFETGAALNVNTFVGGSIFILPGTTTQGTPVGGKVLVAQVTTNGTVTARFNFQLQTSDGTTWNADGVELVFPVAETPQGCTDPEALNYDPDALLDDGSCAYPGPSYSGLSYELVSENLPVAGQRTFRVYANFTNPNDQLTAVFAQSGNPLSIASTQPFYQNTFGEAFYHQINQAFLSFDPSLAQDSWLTIGSAPSVNTVGTTAAETAFESGGAFAINNALGGSWFVLPDLEPLAFPDAQGRVLLAQLTTAGQVTFQANFQYRTQLGENPQELNEVLVFPNLLFGCTDPTACNYDSFAQASDGSCTYAQQYYTCAGACLNDTDGDGVRNELEVPGCTDDNAANFNPQATDENGTCQYPGCTNPQACNFNATANVDNGSCTYAAQYYTCAGACLNDTDGDGVCNELEIPGCTDDSAANFNPQATDDNGTCEYPGCTNPAADNFDATANVDDGSCILGGCTYANAQNFASAATYDDGSCVFVGCTNPNAANYNPLATVSNNTCIFPVFGCTYPDAPNYNPAATVDNGTCELSAANDCPFDTDGNGTVGSGDLLNFLAAYGAPCN